MGKKLAGEVKGVSFDPILRPVAQELNAARCRALASLYRRWVQQLEAQALYLELHSETPPAKRAVIFPQSPGQN